VLRKPIHLALAGLALGLLSAAASSAAPLPPGSIFSINGWNPGGAALGCSVDALDPNVTNCSGTNAGPTSGNFTVQSWNLHLDSDPTVTNFFAIQNNLASPQTFTITVQIPTSGTFGPPVTMQGSMGGSITDTTGNGATLTSSAPTAIYQALVDGSPVQTLLNDPQSFSAGAFGSQTLGPASFGPLSQNIAATTSIGITIKFTVSPSDLVSFTSVFTLIPEPGTLALLAGGIAGIAHFGRRRAAA